MKIELVLELARESHEVLDVFPGVMNLERPWMNLVHRNMDVLVLLVTVTGRDVLVICETSGSDRAAYNVGELAIRKRPILRVERDHHVIGLRALRARVASLVRLHHANGVFAVFASLQTPEVPGHIPSASLRALAFEHVVNESSKAGLGRLVFPALPGLGFDDHTRSASRPINGRSVSLVRSMAASVCLSATFSTPLLRASFRSPPSRF